MEIDHLLILISNAKQSLEELIETSYFTGEEAYTRQTKSVLNKLEDELMLRNGKLSVNLLMEIHGLGVLSFKCFENTKLEDDIIAIIEVISRHIPEYKRLPTSF